MAQRRGRHRLQKQFNRNLLKHRTKIHQILKNNNKNQALNRCKNTSKHSKNVGAANFTTLDLPLCYRLIPNTTMSAGYVELFLHFSRSPGSPVFKPSHMGNCMLKLLVKIDKSHYFQGKHEYLIRHNLLWETVC